MLPTSKVVDDLASLEVMDEASVPNHMYIALPSLSNMINCIYIYVHISWHDK